MINSKHDIFLDDSNLYHVIQPIFDIMSNKVIGYEFLIRSPYFQNPKSLFQYASKNNKLLYLDRSSIFKVLETYSKKKESLKGIYLFINILPSTLIHPVFLKELLRMIEIMNIQKNYIVFEISEVESTDVATLRTKIIELKKHGFLIAIDDIGKGHSSIVSILELEPDIGKLDLYFSNELSHSTKKQEVIKHLIQLFGKQMKFILEGFENQSDLKTALSLGITYGQGFYLGKPKPLKYYLVDFETESI